MAFEFGTSYPGNTKKKPDMGAAVDRARAKTTAGAAVDRARASLAPTPQVLPAPVPPAVPPPIAQPPSAAAPSGAPDWLHAFLTQILGPAIQGQNQNQQAQQQGMMQFRNDATFGRHLDMGGQPIGQGLSFDSLRVPLADRIAKEQATFGASFTGGARVPPTMQAQAATQPPPQSFGTVAREQGMRPPQNAEASWGSPVYRAQHPEYNMFQQQASSTQPIDYPFIQQGRMMQRRMF